ncbi:hypothetical protein PR048_018530, partial [Dryococelus australis]
MWFLLIPSELLWPGVCKKKICRGSLLAPEQSELCSRISCLADVGMLLTSKVLTYSVYTFFKPNHIRCHPDVTQRRCQIVNLERAAELNKYIVDDYFQTLRTVLYELDLMDKSERIFNMKEKGVQLNLHKSPNGKLSRLYCLRERDVNHEYVDKLPQGSNVFMTAKGSMACSTLAEWLEAFLKIQASQKNRIDIHCLQILRVPLSQRTSIVLEETSGRNSNRSSVPTVFSRVWPKALSPLNIISGFRATGIFSYDPNIIPEVAFAPPALSQRLISIPERVTIPSTQARSEPRAHDDITLHDSDSLLGSLESDDDSDDPRRQFTKILRTPQTQPLAEMKCRSKSINCKAVKINRNLLPEQKQNNMKEATSNKDVRHHKRKTSSKSSTLHCHLCNENRKINVIRCKVCLRWAHDKFVGWVPDEDPEALWRHGRAKEVDVEGKTEATFEKKAREEKKCLVLSSPHPLLVLNLTSLLRQQGGLSPVTGRRCFDLTSPLPYQAGTPSSCRALIVARIKANASEPPSSTPKYPAPRPAKLRRPMATSRIPTALFLAKIIFTGLQKQQEVYARLYIRMRTARLTVRDALLVCLNNLSIFYVQGSYSKRSTRLDDEDAPERRHIAGMSVVWHENDVIGCSAESEALTPMERLIS